MKKRTILLSLILTSCAPTIWVKDGASDSDFVVAKARCRMALAGTPMPYQNTNYGGGVGGGMQNLGAAMGGLGDQYQYFSDCMLSQGWRSTRR